MEDEKDPCIVEVKSSDIMWNILVKKTDRIEWDEPVIELSYGWTAGMTKEEIAELPDDCPSGHATVCIMLKQAIALRDRLNEIIGTETKATDAA